MSSRHSARPPATQGRYTRLLELIVLADLHEAQLLSGLPSSDIGPRGPEPGPRPCGQSGLGRRAADRRPQQRPSPSSTGPGVAYDPAVLGRRKRQPRPVTAADPLGSIKHADHREFMPLAGELRSILERQLQTLALRSASPDYPGTAVAFVAQAHRDRHGSYAQWREHRNRRLRSEPSGLYSADTWPASVETESWSVVLLPVEPGVVRSSAAVVQLGRRARRAGAVAKGSQLPLSLSGKPVAAHMDDRLMRGRTPQDIAMSLMSSWIRMTPDEETLSLQAPVLEITRANGTVVGRELVTWALPWPLQAPAIDVPPPTGDPHLNDRQQPTPGAPAVRPLRRRRR